VLAPAAAPAARGGTRAKKGENKNLRNNDLFKKNQ